MKTNWIGIDYGSQKAGTTAIAFCENRTIKFLQSTKGNSADDFILKVLNQQFSFIDTVFIDAPLSLPAAFYKKGEDFMYRKADRALSAMSPMFLGGLTARAMRLAVELGKIDIKCYETYPSQVEKVVLGKATPKKDKIQLNRIEGVLTSDGFSIEDCANRHQYDAFWAWWSGFRRNQNKANFIGDPDEGVIVI